MSDYRVVAAATMTLQNLLLDAIREAVPGATVKTGPPEIHPPEEVGEGLINLFLFKVEPNKVWRNEELPLRTEAGRLLRKPQLPIDLHFLLSFYGDERRKIPYLLLGLALAALHAEPYPNLRHMPQAPRGEAEGGFGEADTVSAALAGSGLEHQPHSLSFSLLPLSHDELIPLFSQIPFVMSVAYRASVLLIEPHEVPEPPLPVRRAALELSPGLSPVLAGVDPRRLPFSPGARLELTGEALGGRFVKVLVGGLEAPFDPEPGGVLSAALPEGIQAGTHLVRVVHGLEPQGGGPVRWVLESNPVALVLEPAVIQASLPPAAAAPAAEEEGEARAAERRVEIRVRFAPPVLARTSVVLLLNETPSPGGGRPPRAYAFQGAVDPTAPDLLAVEATVAPGTYLVRVQIHGVSSPLTVGVDPSSPDFERYAGPRVEIPEVP